MSAANCPETPRQKMIGMMYIFLTAMLAINVSDQVLNAFELVDRSLLINKEIINNNNQSAFNEIKKEFNNNSSKFEFAHKEALLIQQKSDSLCKYIDDLKWKIVRKCDGEDADITNIIQKGNIDVGEEVMIVTLNPSKPNKAKILKDSINSFRDFLLDDVIIDTAQFKTLTNSLLKSLNTDDPPKKEEKAGHREANQTWESNLFHNTPVGAVMAVLTKLQTDIKNAESMAYTHLLSQATAGDIKVNDINQYLITSSTSIVQGGTLNGMAILAARDSTQPLRYELFIDGTPIDVSNNGNFNITTSNLGIHTITGRIISKDTEGEDKFYDLKSQEFEVSAPFATVSATKMNVLYAGVENPISISVPGFSANDIEPRISDGTITPSGNSYIAKPKTPGKEVKIEVYARIENNLKLMYSYPFRVKSLPPPTAFIQYPKETTDAAGKKVTLKENFPSDNSSGKLKKKDLLNAYGIVAELPDSDFEVKYDVLGFNITFYDNMGNAKTLSSTNSKFTNEQISRIKTLSRGKQFFISDIKALGPDNIPKTLPAIDIKIN